MEYEYAIVCNPCGYMKGRGGFTSPVDFTNEQVLQNADHNPGCPVPDPNTDTSTITIASEQQDNVMRYTINVAPLE
jgi:hypothetical protein